jgi:SAM-dependent methyltransferase
MKPDNFITIPFSYNNLDRVVARKSILASLNKVLPKLSGVLLDAGCGKMPYKKFILENSRVTTYHGLDIETAIQYDKAIKPDFTWNGIHMPFDMKQYDCCMATEVLEHCPDPEVFLKEVFRVLKDDGVFFFTVPFIWNLHEVPHDEYRYTPFSITRHLKNSGFTNIEVYATGGWHATMAQMMGLWVKRSGLSKFLRIFLSAIFLPVMKLLLRVDNPPKVFAEGNMITGLYGIARKE